MIRDVAFEVLKRVDQEDSYANLLLPKLIARNKLDTRDAGFTQELAFGTIRNQMLYDGIIAAASGRSLADIDKLALLVVRLGSHQLLQMRVPVHAAINETVDLAKRQLSKGAVGFVNAVLRKISAKNLEQWVDLIIKLEPEHDAKLALRHSHPVWIIKSFRAALESRGLGDQLEALLVSNNLAAKVSLALLPGLISSDEAKGFGGTGPASPIGVDISGNPADLAVVREGRAKVQDQGSQLATLALLEAEVQGPDQNWLDLCAGPGGKAALMAAVAKERNVVLQCNELQPHRAKLVRESLTQFPEVSVLVGDGREVGARGKKYSRILLDAPCTGLGALRRRPEARWRKTASDLTELIKLQRELMASAWDALLPGGVLAYVTCSPHPSETTAQIAWAESKFGKSLALINSNELLNKLNPDLKLSDSYKTAQLWPHQNGTDAMFVALLRKSLG